MKTINLPSTKNGVKNLRVLAKEVYGKDMDIELVYTKGQPNAYRIGENGPGMKAGELADLLIGVLNKQHGEVKINRGQWI